MGTTTQSAVINHSFVPKLRAIKLSIIAFSVAISFPSQAKLEVSALASADTTHQNVKTEDNGTRSLTTFTIAPQVNAVYQTRTFQGLWSGTYNHLERDNDDTSQRQDYAEYKYSAQWVPFKNLLLFQAAGALSYQNTNSANFLLSDFIGKL